MDLFNFSPLSAERLLFLGGSGFETLLVIVKATFCFATGKLKLADEQRPVQLADEYRGEADSSSVLNASETSPEKSSTDVYVNGFAYPQKARQKEVIVALQIPGSTKGFKVIGDRVWERGIFGLTPSAPKPFDRIPIIYERALGGTAFSSNPVGVGKKVAGAALPNFIDIRDSAGSGGLPKKSWGLGPISPAWSPRKDLAGTYDEAWKKLRMPLLPDDFDPRFHLAAPRDQIITGHIRGGERIRIGGMSPDGAIDLTVPTLRPKIEILVGREETELSAECDTIVVDCELMELRTVWRARHNLHGRVAHLHWIRVSTSD